MITRFGKVSKYYDYDGRNKIGTFKISQKVMHQIYLWKTCMLKFENSGVIKVLYWKMSTEFFIST